MGKPLNLDADLKVAMKARDLTRVATLRLLVASAHNKKIELGHDLSNAEIISVLQKEAKKRDESIALYQQAGRKDLADREAEELAVIKAYLPAALSEAEVKDAVVKMKAAGELGTDFGSAMRAVMAKFKGQADGKLVADIVKQEL